MNISHAPDREVVRHVPHLERILQDALEGAAAASGNLIQPRPFLAKAIAIAYDTEQCTGDVISLTWPQHDGRGLTIKQRKIYGALEQAHARNDPPHTRRA